MENTEQCLHLCPAFIFLEPQSFLEPELDLPGLFKPLTAYPPCCFFPSSPQQCFFMPEDSVFPPGNLCCVVLLLPLVGRSFQGSNRSCD